jgi:hypothetical protein
MMAHLALPPEHSTERSTERSRLRRVEAHLRLQPPPPLVATAEAAAALPPPGGAEDSTGLPFRCEAAEVLRQTDILYDAAQYSAFPHLVSLGGGELLLSLRQAPATPFLGHTHPRSLVTLVRSKDSGRSWLLDEATQMGAGGGQELGLLSLGNGVVGGCFAAHEVAPASERVHDPARFTSVERGNVYGNQAAAWVWSSNRGLSWPLQQHVSLDPAAGSRQEHPFARSHSCSAPCVLADGVTVCIATYSTEYGTVEGGPPPTCVLWRSRDSRGQSWLPPVVMAAGDPDTRGYCEPAICSCADGTLRAVYRVEVEAGGGRSQIMWTNGARSLPSFAQPAVFALSLLLP